MKPRNLPATARLLIVAVLAPTLVLALPNVATAAASYGAPGTAEVKLTDNSRFRPDANFDCTIVAYYAAESTSLEVKYKASCESGWNLDTDGMTGSVSFVGVNSSTGVECSMHDEWSLASGEHFSGTAAQGLAGNGLNCEVGQVCVDAEVIRNNTWDSHLELKCAPIDLGAIPGAAADTSCSHGSVTRPAVVPLGWVFHPDRYQQVTTVDSTVTSVGATPDKDTGTGPADWVMYYVVEAGSNPPGPYWAEHGSEANFPRSYGPGVVPSARSNDLRFSPNTTAHDPGEIAALHLEAHPSDYGGAEKPPEGSVIGAGWYLDTGSARTVLNRLGGEDQGLFGVTDPGRCAWYWGAKVATTPDATDEPIGPLDGDPVSGSPTDPAPADPSPPSAAAGCNFSLGDPSSWLSGGMCALVGMMRALITAVTELAGAIVGGIAAMLAAGFTPHPGEWGWEELKTDLEGRAPFSIVSGMGSMFAGLSSGYQDAGSCGTLADFGPGQTVSCQKVKDSPGLSALYGLAQAAILGAAGWGVWTMVARSVGGKQ